METSQGSVQPGSNNSGGQGSSRLNSHVPPSVSPQSTPKINSNSAKPLPLMGDPPRMHHVSPDDSHILPSIHGLPPIHPDHFVDYIVKEPPPPRHRRKRREEDGSLNSLQGSGGQVRDSAATAARGPQFDLEDSAFPPLPGMI